MHRNGRLGDQVATANDEQHIPPRLPITIVLVSLYVLVSLAVGFVATKFNLYAGR